MEASADGDPRGTHLLASMATCPRCDGRLERLADATRCTSCLYTFRDVGNVPLLLRDPEIARHEWGKRIAEFRATMHWTLMAIKTDIDRVDLLPRTRSRLEKILYASIKNAEQVMSLLADAGLEAGGDAGPEGERESRASVPLIRHFELLLRDWAWESDGSTENRRSFERFLAALGASRQLGRTIVLGAGACRLAYDLHVELRPPLTIALDQDPLLLLVTDKVLFGEGIDFFELPVDPIEGGAVCERRLLRPGARPSNLVVLLADALHPPFSKGTFDTVITPWFVDVGADDFRRVLGVVHGLLRDGGRWLNQGPLLYETLSYARRYTKEEIVELLTLGGFDVAERSTVPTTFMVSPLSTHARVEGVFTFSATKRAAAPLPDSTPPAWLVLSHLSVPRMSAALAGEAHPAIPHLRELVDGKRSLREIAEALAKRMRVPDDVDPVDFAGALLQKLAEKAAESA